MKNMSHIAPPEAHQDHRPSARAGLLADRLRAAINWPIPPYVRGGDLDMLRRARLVVTFAWTLIALAIVYAALFFSMNSPIGAAALGLGVTVALATLYVMRRTGSCLVAGNLLTAAFFGVMTALACRLGGHGSIALPWYAAVPVVALSTAGRRSAVVWLAVTASSLAAFYVIDYSGYPFLNDLAPHHYELLGLLAWIGLIVLVLALAFLYESAKEQMLHQVRQSEEALKAERKQMLAMFDSMDEVIYVADPQTYELLYMNGPALKGWGDRVGQPCYRVLQNRDTPCPFCTNDRIFGESTGQAYTWEFQNTINERWYRCIDRAIRWSDGRMVRFEFAIDIHDRKEHEALLEQAKKMAEGHAQRAEQAMADMERMNAVMMGREQRVLEMKQEVNALLAELGQARKYEHV